MTSETDQDQHLLNADSKQLCTSCTTPNDPARHFCSQCGAPLSSYATIAPFEHLFAEGFIYRAAAERPRRLITVIGVWLIFGASALVGASLFGIPANFQKGSGYEVLGMVGTMPIVVISAIMIWRTTRNYLARKKTGPEDEA